MHLGVKLREVALNVQKFDLAVGDLITVAVELIQFFQIEKLVFVVRESGSIAEQKFIDLNPFLLGQLLKGSNGTIPVLVFL